MQKSCLLYRNPEVIGTMNQEHWGMAGRYVRDRRRLFRSDAQVLGLSAKEVECGLMEQ